MNISVSIRLNRGHVTASADIIDALSNTLSYKVSGAHFSDAYQSGRWDGRKRLGRRFNGGQSLTFPVGLLERVTEALDTNNIPWTARDLRGRPQRVDHGPWAGHELRLYQKQAVATCLEHGCGTLRMPVRSGKTLTAAKIAQALNTKTLFVAPSDFLVRQAINAFGQALPEANITAVGGGCGDDFSGDIVVSSIATLAARFGSAWWSEFNNRKFGATFFDESHHIAGEAGGEEWRRTMLDIETHHRFGLTGTLKAENPAELLWAEAACGPVRLSLEIPDLVAQGHLVQGRVSWIRHNAPVSTEHRRWSPTAYKELVSECAQRNKALSEAARRHVSDGKRVLVDCWRVGHARRLVASLRALRVNAALMVGSTPHATRWKALDDLVSGKIDVVVATLLGEGVDIPALDVVINAEGGKESASAVQRLRNLTKSQDKEEAIIVDVVDHHHARLAKWTAERRKMYRGLGFKGA